MKDPSWSCEWNWARPILSIINYLIVGHSEGNLGYGFLAKLCQSIELCEQFSALSTRHVRTLSKIDYPQLFVNLWYHLLLKDITSSTPGAWDSGGIIGTPWEFFFSVWSSSITMRDNASYFSSVLSPKLNKNGKKLHVSRKDTNLIYLGQAWKRTYPPIDIFMQHHETFAQYKTYLNRRI